MSEFVRVDDADITQGAEQGSALEEALLGDPDWQLLDPEEDASADGLDDLTRAELDKLAEDHDVAEPAKLGNKSAVIAAIRDARAAAHQ